MVQTHAKVTRPTLPPVFPRERLFTIIDDVCSRPVIWISGPAGCGKTTLVASYLEARKLPCLWYQMDARDTDPATFFYYMGLAVKQASPRKRKPLPLLTPEYMLGLDTFAVRYFETIYQRLSTPMALVIDNYQLIPPESILHELILNGLSVVPEGVTVILISRENPPPVFSRMLANQEMTHIGWQQVQLTQEETAGIASLQTKKALSEETIRHLHEAAGGWTAGLMLMLAQADLEGIDWKWVQDFTPQEIFDYFGKEVFEKESPETQEFLLTVSFLAHMTPKMAETLTGHPRAGKILAQLNRNNRFTERRLQKRLSYQFHPLFREFLLTRFKEKYSEKERADLCGRAATLLQAEGDREEAAALLRDARAWDALADLIINHAPAMMSQGRNMSLVDWLTSLPKEMVQKSGWLLYWMGSCQSGYAPTESRPVLTQAYQIFKDQQDPVGMVMTWCALELNHFLECSDYSSLDWLIDEVFEFLPTVKDQLPPELTAMLGFHIFSALNMRQPQHPQMEIYADQVDQLIDLVPDTSQRLVMGARLAIYRCLQGELQKANRLVHILRPVARDKTIAPFPRLAWLCGEASYALTTGAFQECMQIVTEGEEITRTTGVRITEGTLLGIGAYALLGLGEYKKAQEYLDRMDKAIVPGRFFEYALHRIQMALFIALQGELGKAMETARAALGLALQSGSPLMEVMSRYGIGQLHTDLSAYQEAVEELERAGTLGRALNSPFAQYMSLVYGAQLQFKLGNEEVGLGLLRDGLAVGRERGYFFCLWYRHDVLVDLYVKALQAEIETDYVREVIRRSSLVPDTPPVHLEKWPWPLKIYTLGSFQLLRDDQPLRFSGKAQRRPLAMLQAIIAFGARDIREEALTDALWPEADGDLAHQSYATTLHRLRRLIDLPDTILRRENRVTVDPLLCWVDLWAFEGLIDKADAAWAANEQDEEYLDPIETTTKAVDLYEGPFLATEGSPSWCIPVRERVRGRFLRAVRRVGEYWWEQDQWEQAADWYERALAKDAFIEEFYRHLMSCYHHMDHREQVVLVYERCCATLAAASPETQALKRQLVPE